MWTKVEDALPEESGDYLTWSRHSNGYGFPMVLPYDDGWNCFTTSDGTLDRSNEIFSVVAWQPIEAFQ